MRSVDLKINVLKTEVVMFDRENGVNYCKLNSEIPEQGDGFSYLGRMFREDGEIAGGLGYCCFLICIYIYRERCCLEC